MASPRSGYSNSRERTFVTGCNGSNLGGWKRLARATKTQPTCANLAQPTPTYLGPLSRKFSFLGLLLLEQGGFRCP